MKLVEKRNRELQHVVATYKTVVHESQQKALDVCRDVFEELESEQRQNQTLQASVASLRGENAQLRRTLTDTTRLFDQTKMTLGASVRQHDQERSRFNSVMRVLSDTAASTDDATKDLRFSQMMTRPAGVPSQ